uniref:NADH-quinone oxidoreductase subunit M n=1 Tax=Candidatus Aschnera chinzeii TaxID=1485666 RepID=A0AAT9G4D2_9ENTR|nr:MAG: NADH-quinone oxidoreductase subunit M [Candidatus Aschnera chinzeii]
MLLILIITIGLYIHSKHIPFKKDLLTNWLYIYSIPWITKFNIHITLAIDDLSLIMIILTIIMGIIVILVAWNTNIKNIGAYYFHVLWMFSGAIGIFMAIDLFLFFFSWEMMLIPMYFLIIHWGFKAPQSSINIQIAIKFFIYTQISSLILLISIFGLVFNYYQIHGIWSFAYEDFLNIQIPLFNQYILLLGFFISFAIKMPLIPFHGWLITTQKYSPITGSLDILGILIKTAPYGLLRFTIPLFPEASNNIIPMIQCIGIITIIYSSLLAFQQKNIKQLISYSIISHMGFIIIGIYNHSLLSYHGVLIQIISNTISGAALIIISNELYKYTNTYNIFKIRGINTNIIWLPGLLLFFALATLGIPGTSNFVGEYMIILSIFREYKTTGFLMLLGVITISIYILRMLYIIYFGKSLLLNQTIFHSHTYTIYTLVFMAWLIIIIGIYPQFLFDKTKDIFESLYNNMKI